MSKKNDVFIHKRQILSTIGSVLIFATILVCAFLIFYEYYTSNIYESIENPILVYSETAQTQGLDALEAMTENTENINCVYYKDDEVVKSIFVDEMLDNYSRPVSRYGKFVSEMYGTLILRTYSIAIADNEQVDEIKFIAIVNDENILEKRVTNISIVTVVCLFIIAVMISILLGKRYVSPYKKSLMKQITFTADASHELKTPLAIIKSNLENVLATPDATVTDISDKLIYSLNEVNRMTKLTIDLLQLAKDDADITKLKTSRVDLLELAMKVGEPYKELMQMQNKTCIISGSHVHAYVDKDKLTQVFIILLDNAIKYTSDGCVVKINIEYLKYMRKYAIITISDDGKGVSDTALENLFARFYREDNSRADKTGSSGLGLSIAQSYIRLHKGKIEAKHNEPTGLKFLIYLPTEKNKPNEKAANKKQGRERKIILKLNDKINEDKAFQDFVNDSVEADSIDKADKNE